MEDKVIKTNMLVCSLYALKINEKSQRQKKKKCQGYKKYSASIHYLFLLASFQEKRYKLTIPSLYCRKEESNIPMISILYTP
jgi:hypothetical protein